jgi:diguanylate cyclase (GGDEF)-like protein/PAS domain S-box-containing protein
MNDHDGGRSNSRALRRQVSPSTEFEAHERQLVLWRMIVRARYVAIGIVALATLLPSVGPHRYWIAAGLVLLVLPVNALYDLAMRRGGVLHPTLAFSDQVFAVAALAVAPELLATVLLFSLAIVANSAVAFGRRVAIMSMVVGFAGVASIAIITDIPDSLDPIASYFVLAMFVAVTVGSFNAVEQSLRIRYAELMGGIDAIVWEQLTRRPTTLYVNKRAEELLGWPVEAWNEPGFWKSIVHPDDFLDASLTYRRAIRRGEGAELHYRVRRADGQWLHVSDRMRVERSNDNRYSVRGVMLDVTETRRAQARSQQFSDLVSAIDLAMFVFSLPEDAPDDELTVLAMNPAAARLVQTDSSTVVGRRISEVIDESFDPLLASALAGVVRTSHGFVRDEFRPAALAAGRVFEMRAFPLPGRAVGLSLDDITQRTLSAEVLRRQALHDGLTGLPNRTQLNERLRGALRRSKRTGDPVGLLVMDLDQFKEVNDALGHDHGDRLLVEMSQRLQSVLTQADTVARLGGDEFAVLLSPSSADDTMATAETIRRALEEPFHISGISLQTNASIGAAVFPADADDADTLVQRADVAMYAAKRGGAGAQRYAPEHDQSSLRRLALLGELRKAIRDDEFVLHYQPVLDLRTGSVEGAEALLRWQHPTLGLVPPGEFVELAEVSGLIAPLTRWVLDHALDQTRLWHLDGFPLRLAVNLSVRNLYDPDLVPWLADRLERYGVDPASLELEVTESELMDDPLLAMDVLSRVKALGATTAIDDFGTGYSSLAYLKHLPIDELKIDKSFVGNMVADDSDLTIVRSTIDLSHNLGLGVIAEGVEDEATLQSLRELGCDRAQGFHISRPLPAEEFRAWVAAWDGVTTPAS